MAAFALNRIIRMSRQRRKTNDPRTWWFWSQLVSRSAHNFLCFILCCFVFFELNQQLGMRQSLYMVRWLGLGESGAVRCGPVRSDAVNSQTGRIRRRRAARRWPATAAAADNTDMRPSIALGLITKFQCGARGAVFRDTPYKLTHTCRHFKARGEVYRLYISQLRPLLSSLTITP